MNKNNFFYAPSKVHHTPSKNTMQKFRDISYMMLKNNKYDMECCGILFKGVVKTVYLSDEEAKTILNRKNAFKTHYPYRGDFITYSRHFQESKNCYNINGLIYKHVKDNEFQYIKAINFIEKAEYENSEINNLKKTDVWTYWAPKVRIGRINKNMIGYISTEEFKILKWINIPDPIINSWAICWFHMTKTNFNEYIKSNIIDPNKNFESVEVDYSTGYKDKKDLFENIKNVGFIEKTFKLKDLDKDEIKLFKDTFTWINAFDYQDVNNSIIVTLNLNDVIQSERTNKELVIILKEIGKLSTISERVNKWNELFPQEKIEWNKGDENV